MSAESDLTEQTFRALLTAAVAQGRRPPHTTTIGPACWIAIDILARDHPDATPDQIVAAFDAFAIEHPQVGRAEVHPELDPLTARAAEFAAIEALTAQLTITYPNVDPGTVAAVVRRIHADFHDHAVREFIPLFVEQAAHRKLA
ncbi:three-helix bundle dimerization domain-containing protein [Mycolicibacterium sp. CBMA 234]|uniref:three-helix bundle dimerization domain-containing protein n=1 Tax=Mycolicibacterium sp. CBMA 234 TaxID=1918495 RepID=UPI0028150426|nr:hypothetical protein [Mycolicibacterium sp. CBMA 234]